MMWPVVAGVDEWTVTTWNLQGSKPTAIDRVAAIVCAAAADVVVVQEVRHSQARSLADRLDMVMTWGEKHHPFRPFLRDRAEGAAILTPHDLEDPGHARVSNAGSMRSYRRRIVQWAVIRRLDDSTCRIVNVHLSPHDFADERRTEARRIHDIAIGFGGDHPVVVGGDFNDDATDEIVDILPGIEPVRSPPTNPSGRPTARLDHVLVPESAGNVSVTVPEGGRDWAELSDHLPLTMRFTLARLDANAARRS